MSSVRAVALERLFGWRPKVNKTVVDILEGRLSYSAHLPVVVSRLDHPRGGYFIIDGYHRVVEAWMHHDAVILAIIDSHIPRIERTGGAHRGMLEDKVNIADYLLSRLKR